MQKKITPFHPDHESNANARMLRVDDLKHGDCRWPIDTEDGIRFCGQKASRLSWCDAHAAIGIVDRRKKAEKSED